MPETPDIPEELPLADVAAMPAEAVPPLSEGDARECGDSTRSSDCEGARNHA
jgi:hypothetical protein